MKPYYEEAGIQIYHGDCREIFPRLSHIDHVLTDPPYGVGVDYGLFVDTEENVKLLVRGLMAELLSNQHLRVNLTCGTRQIHWYTRPSWIMAWINRAGSYCNPWGFTCWQPILCYGKDPYLASGKGSRPDIIEHSETAINWGHPVPKPEGFWLRLLERTSGGVDELLCDPFMGSGTTLRIAKNRGQRCVGIEIEERYCEIAANRLRQSVLDFGPVNKSDEFMAQMGAEDAIKEECLELFEGMKDDRRSPN